MGGDDIQEKKKLEPGTLSTNAKSQFRVPCLFMG